MNKRITVYILLFVLLNTFIQQNLFASTNYSQNAMLHTPTETKRWFDLAVEYEKNGKIEESIQTYRQALHHAEHENNISMRLGKRNSAFLGAKYHDEQQTVDQIRCESQKCSC